MAATFTAENFKDEVLEADQPVIVDFWAPWCGPCKMVGPIIEKLAEELDGVKIGKLNVDDARDIAMEYSIASIPTLLIFKEGKVVDQLQGFLPEPQIREFIEKNL